MNVREKAQLARLAFRKLALVEPEKKNKFLGNLAAAIVDQADEILEANEVDIELAEKSGLSTAMIDRLMLNPHRLASIANDLRSLISISDPVGEVFEQQTLPSGLLARKIRVPIGVLAVIYESRPNVTIDAASLAIKSGNCVILRGGSETIQSNKALTSLIHASLSNAGLPPDAVQFIDNQDRALVMELLQLDETIDMVIPRGGAALHEFCRKNSHIPVITGGIGICHLFVDESADLDKAVEVIRNAKIQRPTVCNALDTVLVHRSVAEAIVLKLVDRLALDGVEFRVDMNLFGLFTDKPRESVRLAGQEDFDTEWLSLVLGIKSVDNLYDAIEHIAAHSTSHSDGILTQNQENADSFIRRVDSAAVYVNASTRFTDGSQLGLGAEMAVSTQRLQARGPMGLRELTTYKWVIVGDYSVRA
jgi:glutamate-5-semialdehyde dehydrogenase